MNTWKVNAYFACLIITLCGSLATLTIVRAAQNNHYEIVYGSEAEYQAIVNGN